MPITIAYLEFQQAAIHVPEVFKDISFDTFTIHDISACVGAIPGNSSLWLFDGEAAQWMQITSNKTLIALCNCFLSDGRDLVMRVQSFQSSANKNTKLEDIRNKCADMSPTAIDPFSQEKIEDDAINLIQIPVCVVRLDGLWLLQFIKSQLAVGQSIYCIEVAVFVESIGEDFKLILTKTIWQQYLLQKHASREVYRKFLIDILGTILALDSSLKDLQGSGDLWQRIKVFHHDLCLFSKYQDNFLTSHDMFMSDYYFSDEERELLFNFPTASGLTVKEVFALNMQHIIKTRGAYEVCASHDIAPLLVTFFKIKKSYEHEKSFQAYHKVFHKQRGKKGK